LPVDTVLHNTKIFIRSELVEAGIAIDKGKIVKIAKDTNLPSASKKINLNGNVTLPGLIDSHVHLRDQELVYKESFFTGTAAAAAGGVTSVVDMPNNKPVTMDSSSLIKRMSLAKEQLLVNVGFFSAFPKNLEEIPKIINTGAVGFKIYLSHMIGGIDIDNDELLVAAFRKARKQGVPVAVHAEDKRILEERRIEMEAAGRNDTEDYVAAHPPEAEAESIKRIIRLVKKSGVHIHFCHISSANGLNAVIRAKKIGLPVTCEVTPHNLLLSSELYRRFGTLALTDPPLRTLDDISALWNALRQGLIDTVASDHAPHSIKEKNVASVWKTEPGVPGLETTLPLLLTQINKGRLSLAELVRATAKESAKIFHLRKRGCIAKGNWADLAVVDMKQEHEIDSSLFHSKAKYSPFDGMHVKGKPIKTFVNGKLVMDEGRVVCCSGIGNIVSGK
jgi:dihydroorotase